MIQHFNINISRPDIFSEVMVDVFSDSYKAIPLTIVSPDSKPIVLNIKYKDFLLTTKILIHIFLYKYILSLTILFLNLLSDMGNDIIVILLRQDTCCRNNAQPNETDVLYH